MTTHPLFADFDGYTFVSVLKADNSSPFQVALYQDEQDKKYVVKTLPDLSNKEGVRCLKNEVLMLNTLQRYDSSGVFFEMPKVCKVIETPTSLTVIRDHIDGKLLKDFNKNIQMESLFLTMEYFKTISKKISPKDLAALPKRNFLDTLTFPLFVLKVLIKKPNHAFQLLKYSALFYKFTFLSFFITHTYSLVHRDLNVDNILVNKKHLSIIDFETAVLTEPEAELATMRRFFTFELTLEQTMQFLNRSLKTSAQKNAFARLSIFYAVHFLSITSTSHPFFQEAFDFLTLLQEKIMPAMGILG